MNRPLMAGTIYNAWNTLADVCKLMNGSQVLDAALRAALDEERERRRVMRGSGTVFRIGAPPCARLFVLQHAYSAASQPLQTEVPKSWTQFAAEPRARVLAYALGEQLRARQLHFPAFPRLGFLEIEYGKHVAQGVGP